MSSNKWNKNCEYFEWACMYSYAFDAKKIAKISCELMLL